MIKLHGKILNLLFYLDILLLPISFLIVYKFKMSQLDQHVISYWKPFLAYVIIWSSISFINNKYKIKEKKISHFILHNILKPNFYILAVLTISFYLFREDHFSRLVVFGNVLLVTFFEMFFFSIIFSFAHTIVEIDDESHQQLLNSAKKGKIKKGLKWDEQKITTILKFIREELGEKPLHFIQRYIDIADSESLVLSTTTKFNVENLPATSYTAIVNLHRINDIRYVNKFFECINSKLEVDSLLIGCAETKEIRKNRIFHRYPAIINFVVYTFDYIFNRLFPKFLMTKWLYFHITQGNNRVISRAEVLGRLVSCGFEIIEECEIDYLHFFAVKKKSEPIYDMDPTYGPLIRLTRKGLNGKLIKVYKLRTMHPYAEYLQEYIFKLSNLKEGGKFKDDFRITTLGRLMRKFWIDELPMILNWIKGELKLVGVRPVSRHYFNLYSKQFQERRIKYKPGLLPPFYADAPKTLEDIENSERKYFDSYDQSPVKTDMKYFFKALFNILFKGLRSA